MILLNEALHLTSLLASDVAKWMGALNVAGAVVGNSVNKQFGGGPSHDQPKVNQPVAAVASMLEHWLTCVSWLAAFTYYSMWSAQAHFAYL